MEAVEEEATPVLNLVLQRSHARIFRSSPMLRLHDSWTQTDASSELDALIDQGQPSARLLQLKLQNVQKKYSVLTERVDLANSNMGNLSMEERMLKFQKECSERSKKEINREVARFREQELRLIEQAERAKFRDELERVKDGLFREHNAKLKALRQRESALEEELSFREQTLRDKLYQDRQNLLAQMRKFQAVDERREQEQKLWEKERQIELQRLKDQESEVASLRQKLDADRMEFAQKCDREIKAYQLAVATEYQERQQALVTGENKLKHMREGFEKEKGEWDTRLKTWQASSERFEEQNEAFKKLSKELQELTVGHEHMRTQNEFLREALEQERRRYDQLHENYVQNAEKHARVEEEADKEARSLRIKVDDFRASLELAKENSSARQHKLLETIEHMKAERNARTELDTSPDLAAAKERIENLQHELEEKEHALVAAQKEVKELQSLLFKARKAFTQISDSPKRPQSNAPEGSCTFAFAPQPPQFIHPSFAYSYPQGFPVPVAMPPAPPRQQKNVQQQEVSEPAEHKEREVGPSKAVSVAEAPQKVPEPLVLQTPASKSEKQELLHKTEETDVPKETEEPVALLTSSPSNASSTTAHIPASPDMEVEAKALDQAEEQQDAEETNSSASCPSPALQGSPLPSPTRKVIIENIDIKTEAVDEEKELERRAAEALAQQRKSRDLERSMQRNAAREEELRRQRELEEVEEEADAKDCAKPSQVAEICVEEKEEVDPLIAQYRASAQEKLAAQRQQTRVVDETSSKEEISSHSEGEGNVNLHLHTTLDFKLKEPKL